MAIPKTGRRMPMVMTFDLVKQELIVGSRGVLQNEDLNYLSLFIVCRKVNCHPYTKL